MTKRLFLKEATKTDWSVTVGDDVNYPGDTNIQLGCLMRIAGATEAMAKYHTQLINGRDRYLQLWNEAQARYEGERRSHAATKAWVTRLKRKISK